jgi:hypothetical protein
MVWRSVPASSRWVAKAWRRAWMPPRFVIPARCVAAVENFWAVETSSGPLPSREGNSHSRGRDLAPVAAQLFQEPGREERVAILAALALLHAEAHPRGVEVAELEPHHLADPQARGIRGGEERPLLAGDRGVEQGPHFGGAQDLGERLPVLRPGDREGWRGVAQGRVVEEPEGLHGDVAGTPGFVASSAERRGVAPAACGRRTLGPGPGSADPAGGGSTGPAGPRRRDRPPGSARPCRARAWRCPSGSAAHSWRTSGVDGHDDTNARDGRSPEAIVGEGLAEGKRESDGGERAVSKPGRGPPRLQRIPTAPAV